MSTLVINGYGGFSTEEIAAIRYAARKHLENRTASRQYGHFTKRLTARKAR